MNSNKDKIQECIDQFSQAAMNLAVMWENIEYRDEKINEVLGAMYPFECCFMEKALEIEEWKEDVTKRLQDI